MTRINTNVSSLIAQTNLSRVNSDLQNRLTRLSTGLRINSGKDDPAGLIASEALRSNIISTEKAIVNNERASQLIATADSALGQVSQLLNDIRGLVTEAANTGVLSAEQIAANQLQIDSSLEAIDRIAQITSFQGKKLLDGSLDFTTRGVDRSKITSLLVDQANFGSHTSIGVEINVVKQATRGTLNYAFGAIAENLALQIRGANGTEAFNFAAHSTIEEIASAINLVSDATGVEAVVEQAATKGQITVSSVGANNDIVLTANEAGFDPGNVRIKYTKQDESAASPPGDSTRTDTEVVFTAASGANPATIEVKLGVTKSVAAALAYDGAANNDGIIIRAKNAGADFNGVEVNIIDSDVRAGEAEFDGSTLNVYLDVTNGNASAADFKNAIEDANTNPAVAALFEVEFLETTSTGAGQLTAGSLGRLGDTIEGVDGGTIVATANEVIQKINAAQSLVTATLAEGNNGYGVVSTFDHFALYGTPESNTRLQFLAPSNAPNIRFVAQAGQSLGIDTSTDPRVEGFASYTVQNADGNGSFTIRAKYKGSEYDGITINIVDNPNVVADNDPNTTAPTDEFAIFDRATKTLTIAIDDGVTTAADIVHLINNDDLLSQFFEAEHFGTSDGSDVIEVSELTLGKTSGGLISPGTLIINLATDENGVVTTTAQDLVNLFADPLAAGLNSVQAAELAALGISVTNAEGSDGSGVLSATTSDITFSTSGTVLEDAQASGTTFAVNGKNAQIKLTAIQAGAEYNDVRLVFEADPTVTQGNETVYYDAQAKILTVHIDAGATTADDVIAAINNDAVTSKLFVADEVGDGTGVVTVADYAVLSGGQVDTGSTDGAALLGNSDLKNLGLTFRSTQYGSDGFVEVRALSGSFKLTNAAGEVVERAEGTDLDARVNGIQVVGKGLNASINTSSLDLRFSVSETVADGEKLEFQITGGGAQFQIGPQVVSNQQARLGIQSVNTTQLGGVSGRLYELRSGGAKSLTADVGGAARVVDEVISIITSLRGRLGAFQKTTLETNIYTLNDTLANLTEAESSIRDADFAKESAALTRAQILTQSTTSVLAIANSNPQNVLALLR